MKRVNMYEISELPPGIQEAVLTSGIEIGQLGLYIVGEAVAGMGPNDPNIDKVLAIDKWLFSQGCTLGENIIMNCDKV